MNEDFFDQEAATWDENPQTVERAEVVARALRDTLPLGPTTRLLEYGAGTGLATQMLRDAVGPVTLADPSAGMRAVIEQKVAAGVLPDARVWNLDLTVDSPPAERFDLVLTVMALHHVSEIDLVLARFHELLDPGGHVAIVDLDHEDGSFHREGFTGHHGFERSALTASLVAAGFTEVTFRDVHTMVRDGVDYSIFLATAVAGAREPT